jgi:hypothetical protein
MTLQQFVDFCKSCNDTDVIYETYFNDSVLTEAIYAEAERLGIVLDDCIEPMRASLEAIGLHYNVQVLADW